MEVWTFINKHTKEIIRFNIRIGDIEFGSEYYFTDNNMYPFWFVDSEIKLDKILELYNHPQYNIFYETPAKDCIDIENYEKIKFEN